MSAHLASLTVFVMNNPFSQRQPSIVRTLLSRVLLLVADYLALPYSPVHSTDAACPRPAALHTSCPGPFHRTTLLNNLFIYYTRMG